MKRCSKYCDTQCKQQNNIKLKKKENSTQKCKALTIWTYKKQSWVKSGASVGKANCQRIAYELIWIGQVRSMWDGHMDAVMLIENILWDTFCTCRNILVDQIVMMNIKLLYCTDDACLRMLFNSIFLWRKDTTAWAVENCSSCNFLKLEKN